jgi:hypothetical protein
MSSPRGAASLVEFSYVSTASPDLPAAVFQRLARQVWSHNTRMGLTGELRFGQGRFDQVIEGPSEVVLSLAARILTDPRHGSIRIRGFRSVEARRFPTCVVHGFDMGPAETTSLASADNLCFFPTARPACLASSLPAREAALGTV